MKDLIPSNHYKKRLKQRFPQKEGNIDYSEFELVTSFSGNRFDHPIVMEYMKRPEYRNCKYLVSPQLNIVLPVLIGEDVIKTVLYYNWHKR